MGLFDGLMNIVTGGKDGDASRASQSAIDAYAGVDVPTIDEQQIQLQKLVQQGVLSPEQAQTYLQQSSGMNDVSTDPRLKEAQLSALSSLGNVANNGGMTGEDQSRMNQMLSAQNQQEQGNRQAIEQNMAQRGQSGSGFDLVAQMMNQQGSANRASQQGMDIKAQAEARALQAMMGQGQMAQGMETADFNQQAQKAQAQDAINRFNTTNQQAVNSQNVGANNAAQQYNLDQSQSLANANTNMANNQQQYNKGLYQTQFNNQMAKAGGVSGATQNQAALDQNQANSNRDFFGNLISAGATAGATYAAKK